MPTIVGRISRLLHNAAGEVHGFSLDTGLDVRFPVDRSSQVLAVATVGARVQIQARMPIGPGVRHHSDLTFLKNLDSMESVDVPSFPTPDSPEVPAGNCAPPRWAAPLVPSFRASAGPLDSAHATGASVGNYRKTIEEIEGAYDQLHRTQAILAYLQILKQEKTSIGQYLDEAKHTYMQALSEYEVHDFEGAREFAAASRSLSHLIEIVISRAFHSAVEYPRIVPLPPEENASRAEDQTARRDLHDIESMLARVRWVAENGTLPSVDRLQVEKIAFWTENLCRLARRFLETNGGDDGVKFTRAAESAVRAAEHLCRRCYVTRNSAIHPAIAS